MKSLSKLQTVLLIGFLVLVWGINWPLSKYALTYVPPILFSGIRTLLGALLLLIVALPRIRQLRWRQSWPVYAVTAAVNITLYYGLQTIGLGYLPSGLFSAIVFIQPVLVGIFSWLWLGESMNALKITGLLLGFAGVGTICVGSSGMTGHISVTGILLALGSALSWAAGTVYVKKKAQHVDPIWMVTMQLLLGGIFMSGAGSLMERWSEIDWEPAFIGSLLFISIFVIAIGWLVFYKLIDSGEASKVASYTFMIPIVAIISGTLFLHEQLTYSLLIGIALIVISIYFVNRQPRRRAAAGN
ncbi:DMT family transporter [Paenibacillus sp. GCM10027626]|uniref:DMT family transporter n=1 Tax=Paenibacillus sp. GCM10027626 TaxID=3273411 RepID=UPI003638222F